MKFLSGSKHPKWKGGMTIHVKGYRRITAGKDRGKLAHRVVIEKLLGHSIPNGFEVHHMPGVPRSCICPQFLILMQECLHHADAATTKKRQ